VSRASCGKIIRNNPEASNVTIYPRDEYGSFFISSDSDIFNLFYFFIDYSRKREQFYIILLF